MVAGSVLAPALVAAVTVAWKEKTLSPATASPCVPSSKNGCAAAPPIVLRFALTPNPVLAGFAPGVTATVSNVELPACTVPGFAAPVPLGLVGVMPGMARTEMSSIASACPLVVVVPEATE